MAQVRSPFGSSWCSPNLPWPPGMAARPSQRRGAVGGLAATGSRVVDESPTFTRHEAVAAITELAAAATAAAREPLHRARPSEGLNAMGKDSIPRPQAGWDWCMGSRPPPRVTISGSGRLPGGLRKSESVPELAGASLLPGKVGLAPQPFFGEARTFGEPVWDGRMRGGTLARSGWAGTFPCTHSRGCGSWA
uniref:Uncharacterized protein n=1 Tax=Alexandrium monilatum TaxID=311494 RepID=A0A6T1LLS8_9DINO